MDIEQIDSANRLKIPRKHDLQSTSYFLQEVHAVRHSTMQNNEFTTGVPYNWMMMPLQTYKRADKLWLHILPLNS